MEGSLKIVVSACLLGENCKYDGGDNLCRRLVDILGRHPEIEVVPVCPEVAGGLPTPRPPAEIVRGRVMTVEGKSVDAEFRAGVSAELERLEPDIEAGEIAVAVLQSRSPSCGVRQVYDGSFSGVLIPGKGLFARELERRGVRLVDASEL